MNEEKDQKPEGIEHDFSEFAKNQRPQTDDKVDKGGEGSGGSFLRGCGIALGVVALVFFFIVGACFMSF